MGDKQISAVEAELYDRQIRLWGIESQEKLRAANVLLINIRALGSEIAKNIVLSGINSLTILDDGVVTEEDLKSNFLLSRDSVGKKIAEEVLLKTQALNPLVKINVVTESAYSKDAKFFEGFTIIVATGVKSDLLLKIDKICRNSNVKLISGDTIGAFGFSLLDLNKHEFVEERVQVGVKRTHDGDERAVEKVKTQFEYPDLNKVLILPNTKQNVDAIKKTKRRNKLFFLLLALIEFRNKTGRDPELKSKEDDLKALVEIKSSVTELYKVPNDVYPDSLFNTIFTKLAPVNAILGGVIAQEVIKAVSQKEVTINNVFLFDPITFSGKEERVGA